MISSIGQICPESQQVWALPHLTYLIVTSKIIHLAQFSRDGTIRYVNNTMAAALKMPEEVLVGMNVAVFLTEADRITFDKLIATQDFLSSGELLLNLVDSEQIPHTLRCRFAQAGDGLLLFGEPPLENNQVLQEELLQINNQLAVLTRENMRKGKDLARALKRLEETHEKLDKSFWHLEKIQEVLPICMECGMVKTADATWEDVVSYLKKNSLFLSHGYCPACADKVLKQYESEQKEAHS